jgi:methylase of polypeptide subunit release factors
MEDFTEWSWDERLKDTNLQDWDLYGYKYRTCGHTDGGGLKSVKPMIDAVMMMSSNRVLFDDERRWNRALDFGCGDGVLGMALLANELVDEVVFVDYYEPAVENCKHNLKQNNLYHTVIQCDGVETLDAGQFDLVICNPPHRRTMELNMQYNYEWLTAKPGVANYQEKLKEHNTYKPHRSIDWGWELHKRFYANIHKHLVDGADVFMYESGDRSSPLNWEWGDPVNLIIKEWADNNAVPRLDKSYVLHLIANIPTNK